MAAAHEQQQDFGEMRSQAEEILRRRPSKWDMAMNLTLICLGGLLALWGALDHSRPDLHYFRIAMWAAACCAFFLGAGFLCWDLYLRRKLKKILEAMQSAMDLESAGELRFTATTRT